MSAWAKASECYQFYAHLTTNPGPSHLRRVMGVVAIPEPRAYIQPLCHRQPVRYIREIVFGKVGLDTVGYTEINALGETDLYSMVATSSGKSSR